MQEIMVYFSHVNCLPATRASKATMVDRDSSSPSDSDRFFMPPPSYSSKSPNI